MRRKPLRSPKLSTGDTSRVFFNVPLGHRETHVPAASSGTETSGTEFFSAMSDAYIRLWRGKKKFRKQSLAISFVGLVFGGCPSCSLEQQLPELCRAGSLADILYNHGNSLVRFRIVAMAKCVCFSEGERVGFLVKRVAFSLVLEYSGFAS